MTSLRSPRGLGFLLISLNFAVVAFTLGEFSSDRRVVSSDSCEIPNQQPKNGECKPIKECPAYQSLRQDAQLTVSTISFMRQINCKTSGEICCPLGADSRYQWVFKLNSNRTFHINGCMRLLQKPGNCNRYKQGQGARFTAAHKAGLGKSFRWLDQHWTGERWRVWHLHRPTDHRGWDRWAHRLSVDCIVDLQFEWVANKEANWVPIKSRLFE